MGRDAFDVVIAGGGLAGLSAAYHLRDWRVLLCEKDSVLGGRIRTRSYRGLAYDMGAVLAYKKDYLPFEPADRRLIAEGGPVGLAWDSKIFLGEGARECLEECFRGRSEDLDAIGRFERGEVGPEGLGEAARKVVGAFFQGIHPGEVEDYVPERRSDAFERYAPSHYPGGNLGLVADFAERITASVELSAEVRSVERDGDLFRLVLVRGTEEREALAKAVVLATTASSADRIMAGVPGFDRGFLRSVKYGSFVTVALGTRAVFPFDFSYLVTPGRSASTIYKMGFPGSPLKILLLFFCDRAAKRLEGLSDEDVAALSIGEARAAGLPISPDDLVFRDVARWKEGGTIVSPAYHEAWTPAAAAPVPGVFLAGDYLYRDFPYGMEAAVRSGEASAAAVDEYLARGEEPEARLLRLGARAAESPPAMICRPPFPEAAYAYGDLVPLGFLLRGLKALSPGAGRDRAVSALEALVRGRRRGPLWAFHTGRLVTATDSSLVMLGMEDAEAVEALEAFSDGRGGYYPQLWSAKPEPDRMELAFNNRHWCGTDYATTCLVAYLRRRTGLERRTPLGFFEEGFDRRSGLFFANPFLTDWALALALGAGKDSRPLAERLVREILAARDADGGFGRYDRVLSTALAVLALRELDAGEEETAGALRFLGYSGRKPVERARPFYSADRVDFASLSESARIVLALGNGESLVELGGRHFLLTTYEDSRGLIETSLVVLARTACARGHAPSEPLRWPRGTPHPRYLAETAEEYAARFALPPYAGTELPEDEGDKAGE